MERIQIVLDRGAEPHVQPLMKLNTIQRRPWVRFDWTEETLQSVARWANRRLWRYAPFDQYEKSRRRRREVRGDQIPLRLSAMPVQRAQKGASWTPGG